MKRKGNFAKGCSIWLATVIVLEILMLLFLPGCGLFQLSAINFLSGNAVKSFLPSYFPPPITYSQNLSAFASQGILYASSSPYSYAIRMSDGRLLQKTENTFTAADGGIYYTTTSDAPNTLLAVRVLDSTLLWKFSPGGTIDKIQAIDDVAYIIQGNRLTGLNARNGKLLWHFQQQDSACAANYNCNLSNLQASHGIAYVTDGSELFALNTSNGTLLWHTPYTFYSSPLIVQNTISLLSASNIATTFRASDGKFLWQFLFPENADASFQRMTDGTHHFYYADSRLYVLDAQTGKLLWHWSEKSISRVNDILQVIVSGDTLYLATPDTLVAIRLADGKERWSQDWKTLWNKLNTSQRQGTPNTLNPWSSPGNQFHLLGASDGLVFIQFSFSARFSTDIIALRAAHGNTVWQRNITMAHTAGMNTPVPLNSPYITASNNPPILLDTSTLYLTYSVLVTDGPPPAHFVISIDQAHQPAYTSTYTVYTLAFNARDGSIKWHDRQAEQYTGCC